jgi:hypothetical protein
MKAVRGVWLVVLLGTGCGGVVDPARRTIDDGPTAPPPAMCAAPLDAAACRLSTTLTVGADGLSEPFAFVVPAAARALSIEVIGADRAVYALAALVGPDGRDLVALPSTSGLPATMRDAFNDDVGLMPGALYQTIRLGTFAHTWPYAPSVAPAAGTWSLRVAGDMPGDVQVRVHLPPDDGARTLHVNLVGVAKSAWAPLAQLLPATQAILDQAGLTLVVDATPTLDSMLSIIDEPFGTVPGPSSEMVALARQARPLGVATALDVLVIDRFDANPNVTGVSLGAPGPDDPSSYYWAVLVAGDADATRMAHSLAHELSHFLGLQHTQNVDLGGNIDPDPIDDTDPSQPNLMGPTPGTTLTAGQSAVLRRSPLLVPN